ncbi:hypothetical protein PGTUg99_026120 [Puccinia graminis f. sp. tritici]|uniref:Uncharacterized protein n=1 Tax=Puccinia graminis f. sp. tritici TaxID=56615 RepID=A0A5B0LWL9_PUCGR|nr:hypothetical protein PGTUg99_026120 [Puccinia graminis f. sp. tritici]
MSGADLLQPSPTAASPSDQRTGPTASSSSHINSVTRFVTPHPRPRDRLTGPLPPDILQPIVTRPIAATSQRNRTTPLPQLVLLSSRPPRPIVTFLTSLISRPDHFPLSLQHSSTNSDQVCRAIKRSGATLPFSSQAPARANRDMYAITNYLPTGQPFGCPVGSTPEFGGSMLTPSPSPSSPTRDRLRRAIERSICRSFPPQAPARADRDMYAITCYLPTG